MVGLLTQKQKRAKAKKLRQRKRLIDAQKERIRRLKRGFGSIR